MFFFGGEEGTKIYLSIIKYITNVKILGGKIVDRGEGGCGLAEDPLSLHSDFKTDCCTSVKNFTIF